MALIGADLGKSTLDLSPLAFSITRYRRHFQRCPGHQLQTSLNAALPQAPGEAVGCVGQQLLQFVGSFGGGFVWSLSVAGTGQLSRAAGTRGCHSFAYPTRRDASPAMEQPLLESKSCFIHLSSYTINSSILLLCIHFLSCSSCHICTRTSWFPIFNCPQRASSRATPAFVWALICHCPNWSSKCLKFSLYDCVVFLQMRD